MSGAIVQRAASNSTPLQIGSVAVRPPTVLAPMEGLTDAVFRTLVRSLGPCGLVVTELVSARELRLRTARALRAAAIEQDSRPVAIQIYGSDPETLGEAARMAEALGPDIIDINMGCPSKAVTRRGAGAALMKDLERATAIVRAVRRAVTVPITVKMRLGWDDDHVTAPELARRCELEGADGIAVHARTRRQMYRGGVRWDQMARVKEAVTVPVIGNGDVVTARAAVEMLRVSGADGVMAGRAVVGNPWLLVQIAQTLAGEPVIQPSLMARRAVLLEHYARVLAQYDHPRAALGQMKRIIGYYTDSVPNADRLRRSVFHSRTTDEAIGAVKAFFEAQCCGAGGATAR